MKRERQRLAVKILGQQGYDSDLSQEEPEMNFGRNTWSHRMTLNVVYYLHIFLCVDVSVVVCSQELEG